MADEETPKRQLSNVARIFARMQGANADAIEKHCADPTSNWPDQWEAHAEFERQRNWHATANAALTKFGSVKDATALADEMHGPLVKP